MGLEKINFLEPDFNKFCRRCKYYQWTPSSGIICGYSKKKPRFSTNCSDFVIDQKRAAEMDYKNLMDSKLSTLNKVGMGQKILMRVVISTSSLVIGIGIGLFGYFATDHPFTKYLTPIIFCSLGVILFFRFLFTSDKELLE